MIYLFCNEAYGQPLLREAAVFCRDRGVDLRVVLSARVPGPGVPAWKRAAIRKLARWKSMRVARAYGVTTVAVPDVNAVMFADTIAAGDVGIVGGFNQIFRGATIARFASLVNFHPSVLPLYRGPVPSYWCLKHGEAETGYTLHRVAEEIDAGEVLFQDTVRIEPTLDEAGLDRRIGEAAIPTLRAYLRHLTDNEPWSSKTVDASRVYAEHVDYMGFPRQLARRPLPCNCLSDDSQH